MNLPFRLRPRQKRLVTKMGDDRGPSTTSTVLQVGFQGEPGAYSESAVKQLFREGAPVPLHSFHRVFEAVEIGTVDHGVVPIENSHAGSINETYDLLVKHGVRIVGETIVRISHCLVAPTGTSVKDVRVVFSHAQALEQCDEFLESLSVEKVAVHDTAGAARIVSQELRPGSAAIASREAAEIYGLQVIATDLEDSADNSTKFVAIGIKDPVGFGPPDKTSIVFSTADTPGALYRCLKEFSERGVNLSKIESRPSRARAWRYHFYLDFDTASSDERAREALEALGQHTTFLRVLGSYPTANP